MNNSKLLSVILLASISSASLATESEHQDKSEGAESTFWGLGIGSVLGGVIAGPPGIAIGASLGGALGWGKDQNEALEQSQEDLRVQEALASESSSELTRQTERLKAASVHIGELKRRQKIQIEEMNTLRAELDQKNQTIAQSDLSNVLEAYTQEVYFEKGQAGVPAYAKERIADLASFLTRYPNLEVKLTGFTDQSGPASFNEQLSQARAEGVRDALHSQGIALERMSIQSQGEARASVAEGDHANAILDRRVAIELSQIVLDELISDQDEKVLPTDSVDETTLAEWVK